MPRSAQDATRFTSTTPHASSKTPPPPPSAARLERQTPFQNRIPRTAASPPPRRPAPLGEGPVETPQEKVARLRAAAARARDAKVSTFDKVIVRGRVWADRAHRLTALSLIGITGIAGVVTVYALGDMIIYNRRRKSEYVAEQKALQNVDNGLNGSR